ncbi:hypothetical protein [Halocalculus aciditolerans]|uniref:Uncharacterized protein n=1 Tax=Halocalculus aciditolerans TaxID=1383812 RepID=A0A830FAB2_9EURY|nr:hypothetical protein [Halocalculus aciditolerans]GGL55311.1 hypothetical protein GCM10009039_11810 [Halocalculus aciditolerans]
MDIDLDRLGLDVRREHQIVEAEIVPGVCIKLHLRGHTWTRYSDGERGCPPEERLQPDPPWLDEVFDAVEESEVW